jgi:pimeloyl-ACP methyl ester carboxylesterase
MFFLYGILSVLLAAWLVTRLATAIINFRFPPLGAFMQVQGTRLHVLELAAPANAAPDAPVFVLLHGASGNIRDALGSIGRSLNEHYRVVLVDRPGQGHSQKKYRHQSDPRIQADMVAEVMDRLKIDRAIVVGHSWGGAVAAAFGYQHRDKAAGLVFVAPASHPWPGGIDWHYKIGARPVIGRVFSELLAFPIGIGLVPCALRAIFRPGEPPDIYRETVGAAMVLRPASFLANCQDIADLFANVVAMQARYPEIDCPVEIVTGDSDHIVAPAIHSYGLVRDIRGAALTVLPGVGHMPQWSEPAAVLQVIERAGERARQIANLRQAAE